jgi:protein-disulfide isomerase
MDTTAMLKLIVETGTSPAELKSFLEGDKIKEIEEQIPEHAKLIEKFGLTATPTVSIAGKMRVTPDHAQGDPQKFAMLLNGLISRFIEGGRNA